MMKWIRGISSVGEPSAVNMRTLYQLTDLHLASCKVRGISSVDRAQHSHC